MTNPKLIPWLKIGVQRFAKYGLPGLNPNHVSDELKIAKTSLYHFFGNKEKYFDAVCAYWEYHSTTYIAETVMGIENPYERIQKLDELLKGDVENKFFYIQLKSASLSNEIAKKYFTSVQNTIDKTVCQQFLDFGQDLKTAKKNTALFKIFQFGKAVLDSGIKEELTFKPDEKDLFRIFNIPFPKK